MSGANKEPSGAQWCARFPTSVSLDDLAEPFRGNAKAFLAALAAGGAICDVAATYRPPERAYLMHFACMVALSGQDPAAIPEMPGVGIDWTCGGVLDLARHNARLMIAAYAIKFPAALVSRHTQGRALDVTITLPTAPKKVPSYRDAGGRKWILPTHDAASLTKFGATFKVVKLAGDPPHWSDDGH